MTGAYAFDSRLSLKLAKMNTSNCASLDLGAPLRQKNILKVKKDLKLKYSKLKKRFAAEIFEV